jgi:hypothetical protein
MKYLIVLVVVCLLSACSLSDKDKDRVYEVGVACIGLEGEEWRDCMVDEAVRIMEEALEEDI